MIMRMAHDRPVPTQLCKVIDNDCSVEVMGKVLSMPSRWTALGTIRAVVTLAAIVVVMMMMARALIALIKRISFVR